jgi:hypothetical protein
MPGFAQRFFRRKKFRVTTCCSGAVRLGRSFPASGFYRTHPIIRSGLSGSQFATLFGFGSAQCIPFAQSDPHTDPPKSFNSIRGGFRGRNLPQPGRLEVNDFRGAVDYLLNRSDVDLYKIGAKGFYLADRTPSGQL